MTLRTGPSEMVLEAGKVPARCRRGAGEVAAGSHELAAGAGEVAAGACEPTAGELVLRKAALRGLLLVV